VKVLALAPRARLHWDRVVDALWPDLSVDAALPRLHRAAHWQPRTGFRCPDCVSPVTLTKVR
jgi:hypothetical protein